MFNQLTVVIVFITDKNNVGVNLKQGCGALGSDTVVLHLNDNVVLALAACKNDDLLCLHNGADTHSYCLSGNVSLGSEETGVSFDSAVCELYLESH